MLEEGQNMTNSKQQMNKSSGSAIIEYTIVFPLVLLVFFALFYAGFVLRQRAVLDSAVNRGVIYGARLLGDPQYETIVSGVGAGGDALDCENANFNFNSQFDIEPYRYVFDFRGTQEKAKVKAMTEEIIKSNSFLTGNNEPTVECEYKNYVFYQEITVKAKQEFPLPEILKLVGVEDKLTLESIAVQSVTDPDEFIRNVDLTIDVIGKIFGKTPTDAIKGVVDKINTFIDSIFKK